MPPKFETSHMTRPKAGVYATTIALAWLLVSSAWAGEPAKRLRVGISPFPPFVITDGAEPEGASIDLWRALAQQLGVEYELVLSADMAANIRAVVDGKVDVAVGGLTITKRREEIIDFTHPTFHTGLDIMVRQKRTYGLWGRLMTMFTKARLAILISFGVVVLVAAHLMWLSERRDADSLFGQKYRRGISEGIYWAIVTASTVGYGDKVPRRWPGKALAVAVIIVILPLFALFLAELTSSFTVRRLYSDINGPEDLPGRRVGVERDSAAAEYVSNLRAQMYNYDRIETAYADLIGEQLDAMVSDAQALQYYAQREGRGKVWVVGKNFLPQDFALAVAEGSPLRERLNRAILALIERREINKVHVKWFGVEKR